ncbi:hypothetical protein [Flavobacterium sp.]|uniref:hypothetical protein n=1 Tax=Flavobacterium sp. TaxID=239 RepID=UPI0039E25822
MKYVILFLFVFCKSFSQNDSNFVIEGITLNCEKNNYDSRERYVKLKANNEIIQENIKQRFGEFKIKNLKKGEYTFEFTNIFGQIITKNIVVNEKITKVELCTEEFVDTNQKTILENLTQNDTLEISITSSGCFHFEKEKIKYYYKSQKLIAEYFNNQKKEKRITLNERKREQLILLEKKIIAINNSMGGCTSSTQYVFILNGKAIQNVVDSSCDWDGYYKMKEEIFGIK